MLVVVFVLALAIAVAWSEMPKIPWRWIWSGEPSEDACPVCGWASSPGLRDEGCFGCHCPRWTPLERNWALGQK